MSIEINRVRASGEGVTFEVWVPNIGTFARIANEIIRTEPRAFSAAEQLDRRQSYDARHAATESAQRIPRASVPPYAPPLPESVVALMARQGDEPEGLKAGEAYEPIRAGGTD